MVDGELTEEEPFLEKTHQRYGVYSICSSRIRTGVCVGTGRTGRTLRVNRT